MSLRGAINAMCKACIYDPQGTGTWLAQVEACTAPACPLFNVRPKTIATTKAEADPANAAKGRQARAVFEQTTARGDDAA